VVGNRWHNAAQSLAPVSRSCFCDRGRLHPFGFFDVERRGQRRKRNVTGGSVPLPCWASASPKRRVKTLVIAHSRNSVKKSSSPSGMCNVGSRNLVRR